MLVRFEDCEKVHVDQLTLTEAACWCFDFIRCRDLRAQRLSIFNRMQDGIDLESCEDVAISDCNFKCGDDGIVLLANRKVPTRNVTIANCIIQSRWAGIRFGPLSHGDIKNVAVSNCVLHDCNGGGIKIGMYEGGEIRNCTFANIVMERVTCPISIFLGVWAEIGSPQNPPPLMPVGKIGHLRFSHIVGNGVSLDAGRPDAGSVLFFQGWPGKELEDISLSDIQLTVAGEGTAAQAARRDMVDTDQIDYRQGGYWHENKSTWGIPPAACALCATRQRADAEQRAVRHGKARRACNGLLLSGEQHRHLRTKDQRISLGGFRNHRLGLPKHADSRLPEQIRRPLLPRRRRWQVACIGVLGNDLRNFAKVVRSKKDVPAGEVQLEHNLAAGGNR